MNGTEQRTHTRKTQELADIIGDTQAAVIARFEEVEARMHEFRERLDDERLTRKLATGTTDLNVLAVLRRTDDLDAALAALRDRTFWGRLRWLVTGR